MSQNRTDFYVGEEFQMQKSPFFQVGILGWAIFRHESAKVGASHKVRYTQPPVKTSLPQSGMRETFLKRGRDASRSPTPSEQTPITW
jgi:hypothetical protein